jgi:hypothetical protein
MYPVDLNWWAMEALLLYWTDLLWLAWFILAAVLVIVIRNTF